MSKPHQKHEKIARPALGTWGRTELSLHGASCETLSQFKDTLVSLLPEARFAWVDAAHEAPEATTAQTNIGFRLRPGATDLRLPGESEPFLRHLVLRDADLVLINGNHFNSTEQVLFVTDEKPMEQKLDRLQHLRLVLVPDADAQIPAYLVPYLKDAQVLGIGDADGLAAYFRAYISRQSPLVNGLIMAGGGSTRMGQDKSLIDYHGKPQRDFLLELLAPVCKQVFVSCKASQHLPPEMPVIADAFLGIGPMAGLLSAFQQQPDSAWLAVACDLPYLSRLSIDALLQYRDPTRLATAFMNGDAEHPEPLITIWEPKAYPRLLLALSEGITCPRKVLINSDVRLLQAPDERELINANDPASYEQAVVNLKAPGPRS